MTTTPQPPYQQTGWAGMAQHAHQYPAAPVVRHSRTAGLVAAGAGAAMVLGSFLPWATISAPIVGSISKAGTDGSDGWLSVAAGLVLIAYGLFAAARELPWIADVVAVGAGVGGIVWAAWHIFDLQRASSTMQDTLTQNAADDPLGISAGFAAATQMQIGGGLWLLVAAGLVAAIAAGFGLYKRF